MEMCFLALHDLKCFHFEKVRYKEEDKLYMIQQPYQQTDITVKKLTRNVSRILQC